MDVGKVAKDAGREWLEADGLGGFASGPVAGPRTRRYHALLLAEAGGTRFVLVNGADVTLETEGGSWALSCQAYAGAAAAGGQGSPPWQPWLEAYDNEPWPRWIHALPDGTRVAFEILARHGRAQVFLCWRLLGGGAGRAVLRVRPFLSGRDYHALHHENPAFRFQPEARGRRLVFCPYDGVPAIALTSNGRYHHQPCWYRRFHYAEEAARGMACEEDLAAPGEIELDLARGEGVVALACEGRGAAAQEQAIEAVLAEVRSAERGRRAALGPPLLRAADAYVVQRGGGSTIIAGYPWFTDWGRDTFIALRGLCLATGRLDVAGAILLRWAGAVSGGLLPNRFPDGGAAPEYNTADAALWFAVAVFEYLALAAGAQAPEGAARARLVGAVEEILAGHAAGTRFRIGATADGLLAAGEPGVQLTWMDAKVGDWVVTPRIGKPVEIQALWLNALWIGERLGTPSALRWRELFDRGRATFEGRFWNAAAGQLHDVVDVDHQPGTADASGRPNQIFAVGGLPVRLLHGERARAVVDVVEAELLTPLGLRTLSPRDPRYRPRYQGDLLARDGAYHQGTVWPWLMGPFVEAWVRVRGGTDEARRSARQRFLPPLQHHLEVGGVGHLCEVADGEPPHTPGGCPFQAWSLGELLRLDRVVLGEGEREAARAAPGAGRAGDT
jgi:predicted glycogen debranching enzyme